MCIFACIHHSETAENMSVLSEEKVKGETDTVQVMIATQEQKVIGYPSFFDLYLVGQGYTGLLCTDLLLGLWYDNPQPSSESPLPCHWQSVVYLGTCHIQVLSQECDSIETAECPCSSHDSATSCHDLFLIRSLKTSGSHTSFWNKQNIFWFLCITSTECAILVPGSHEVREGNKIRSIYPFSAEEKSRINNQWKKLILQRF